MTDEGDPDLLPAGRDHDEEGPAELLDRAFATLAGRFDPERAGDGDLAFQWDIATPDGIRSYAMTLEGGRCTVTTGVPEAPRVLFGTDLADFLRLVTDPVDWRDEFLAGRLRLSGDMVLARDLERWLATRDEIREGADRQGGD